MTLPRWGRKVLLLAIIPVPREYREYRKRKFNPCPAELFVSIFYLFKFGLPTTFPASYQTILIFMENGYFSRQNI